MFILSGPLISIIAVLMFVMFPYFAIRDIAGCIKKHTSQKKSRTAEQHREKERAKKDDEWERWKKQWNENTHREQELRNAIEAASDPEEKAALRTQLITLLHEMSH